MGFVHSVFIFATRFLLASEVTFFMLLEFSLGPFWVWIFLNETISQETFYGGIIVMISAAVYSLFEIKNSKIKAISTGWLQVKIQNQPHHRLWVTPTNSSQSDTLQVKSHILVKSPTLWYILGSPKTNQSINYETPTHHPLLPSSFFSCDWETS